MIIAAARPAPTAGRADESRHANSCPHRVALSKRVQDAFGTFDLLHGTFQSTSALDFVLKGTKFNLYRWKGLNY
jgi:hypothetical protein